MRLRTLALLAILSLASACITADGVLESDGRATLTLTYPVAVDATEAQSKKLLEAPDVVVEGVTIEKQETGGKPTARVTAKLSTAAVANLANVPFLQLFKTTIQHTKNDDGSGHLAVELSTGKPAKDKEPAEKKADGDSVRIRITLPGSVSKTSAKADGKTVEWSFPQHDLVAKGSLKMTATYASPSASAPAEDPAAAAPADAAAK